jgi:hypothetical protein
LRDKKEIPLGIPALAYRLRHQIYGQLKYVFDNLRQFLLKLVGIDLGLKNAQGILGYRAALVRAYMRASNLTGLIVPCRTTLLTK